MKISQIVRAPDAFQQPVDETELRTQLTRALPGEQIAAVIELEAGLFNNTYRVDTADNAFILKVAPHRSVDVLFIERDLMPREQTIAPQLQAVSLLVPKFLSFFTIGERNASLQPFIEGTLWHDAIDTLSQSENDSLWQQLGAFAQRVHSARGDAFGYPAPSQSFPRWSEFIAHNVAGLLADCRRHDVLRDEVVAYQQRLPHFEQALDAVAEPRLLHGDLWPRNVLFAGAGTDIRLQAVFDGERAYWGDPVSDWVLVLYELPDAFWQGYGENLLQTVDPVRVALYRGMYFIINILECVRFQVDDTSWRQRLAAINAELDSYRAS